MIYLDASVIIAFYLDETYSDRAQALYRSEVDLVDLRSAPLPLLGSIVRERMVLVDRRRSERHAWEASTLSRWLDFEPALRRSSAIRREKLAQRDGIGR